MMSVNLFKLLHGGQVKSSELECVLQEHYRDARGAEAHAVIYPGRDDYSVKLTYTKRGILKRIDPGPAFTEADLTLLKERVEQDLLADRGYKIVTTTLFAGAPVRGYFRCDDFQIIGMPEGFQLLPGFTQHPFVLQYNYPHSPCGWVTGQRVQLRREEIELFLCGMLKGQITAPRDCRRHWVLVPHDNERFTSEYLQEGYLGSTLPGPPDSFTSVGSVEPIPTSPPNNYYQHIPNGSSRSQPRDSNDPGNALRLVRRLEDATPRSFSSSLLLVETFS
jgi:hypothetical protein